MQMKDKRGCKPFGDGCGAESEEFVIERQKVHLEVKQQFTSRWAICSLRSKVTVYFEVNFW